jgi:hypothetical protein
LWLILLLNGVIIKCRSDLWKKNGKILKDMRDYIK